jgi:hypothetical protein
MLKNGLYRGSYFEYLIFLFVNYQLRKGALAERNQDRAVLLYVCFDLLSTYRSYLHYSFYIDRWKVSEYTLDVFVSKTFVAHNKTYFLCVLVLNWLIKNVWNETFNCDNIRTTTVFCAAYYR